MQIPTSRMCSTLYSTYVKNYHVFVCACVCVCGCVCACVCVCVCVCVLCVHARCVHLLCAKISLSPSSFGTLIAYVC